MLRWLFHAVSIVQYLNSLFCPNGAARAKRRRLKTDELQLRWFKKQCCCQKTWGLLRFLGQNSHATNSVITTTFTSYFYQYSRLPPIFSMGRSHIIDHYRTIRRLFAAGTRLHSHLNVSHFITVSEPRSLLTCTVFLLTLHHSVRRG